MAYSVNPLTRIVFVPKADLVLVSVSPEEYNLDVVTFWQEIHDIQDNGNGGGSITYPRIMTANAPTAFAPRAVEIQNLYLVEFEDGPYTVNLINANSDIITNSVQNQVSIQSRTLTGASASDIVAAFLAAGLGYTPDDRDLTELRRIKQDRIDATTQMINENNGG